MCYPVCGMVHINELLLQFEIMSSPCAVIMMWRQQVSSLAICVVLYHMSNDI